MDIGYSNVLLATFSEFLSEIKVSLDPNKIKIYNKGEIIYLS